MTNEDLNELTAQRVEVLYDQSFASILASFSAAVFLSIVLWGQVKLSNIVTWITIVSVLTGVRLFLVFKYNI